MAKFAGGAQVDGGYYWCPKNWEIHVIPQEGGKLPRDGASQFLKVPFPLLFAVIPAVGGLFLFFLPAIGFGLFVYAIARKAAGGVKESATELASTMTPGWQPGEAHFTGKPGEEKPADGKAPDQLASLEKEIAARKNEHH